MDLTTWIPLAQFGMMIFVMEPLGNIIFQSLCLCSANAGSGVKFQEGTVQRHLDRSMIHPKVSIQLFIPSKFCTETSHGHFRVLELCSRYIP